MRPQQCSNMEWLGEQGQKLQLAAEGAINNSCIVQYNSASLYAVRWCQATVTKYKGTWQWSSASASPKHRITRSPVLGVAQA